MISANTTPSLFTHREWLISLDLGRNKQAHQIDDCWGRIVRFGWSHPANHLGGAFRGVLRPISRKDGHACTAIRLITSWSFLADETRENTTVQLYY